MKRAAFFLALALLAAPAGANEVMVRIENPLDTPRTSETVSLNWNALVKQVPELSIHTARVLDLDGNALLTQVIDQDGDGESDLLLFQVSPGASETIRVKIVASPGVPVPPSEISTHARPVPERKDDFAWENDLVAFRAYGPPLEKGDENSGYDCFMKRVKYPVVDKWYRAENAGRSYHFDYGEGYDGYKVGSSLGAGGSAVWAEDRLNMMEVYQSQKLLGRGAVRSSFTLTYGPRTIAGLKITETRTVSLDLGHRLFKVVEKFLVNGKPGRLDVAVGLATHEGAAQVSEHRDAGYLFAWEKIDNHGLGTAVALDPGLIKDYRLIDSPEKYQGNAFFIVDTGDGGAFEYYAGYGWEKAGEIKTPEDWEAYLKDYIRRARNPLKVTVE